MTAGAAPVPFNIRHRLVGAVVLVGLAVVVLPLMLNGSGSGPSTVEVDIRTPSQQRAPREFISRIEPVGTTQKTVVATPGGAQVQFTPQNPPAATASSNAPAAPAAPEKVAPPAPAPVTNQPAPAPTVRVAEPEPVQPAPAPAPAPEPTVVAKAPPPPKPVPVPVAGAKSSLAVETDRGWIVSVGVFANPANLSRRVALLKAKKFDPQVTRKKSKDGKVTTRVWVGPFKERVTAGRIEEKLERATGEPGFIMAYP